MTIHETIRDQVREAMRARNSIRLDTLRSLVALFSNELITKKSSEPYLDDESAISLIKRSIKQHKDSIEQFEKGNRPDLVEKEKAELKVLEEFQPKMMSREEIRKIAEAKLVGGGLDKARAGQFVGQLMRELKGQADGADVKAVVDELTTK